jgi:hypothetical protein
MDSTTFDEYSEAQELRNHLAAYQGINGGLSKKIQELKIQLNEAEKELLKKQNELMETKEMVIQEQRKFEELKRFCAITNGHCINFFKKFHENLEQLTSSDLNITLNMDASQAGKLKN